MASVLQPWMEDLPLMMQGTILTGIRGPDPGRCPKMKPVVRWIRAQVMVQGNPENDFMQVGELPSVEDFEDELEYMPVHYFRHFLHTLEIIGYKHPEYEVAEIASDYYNRLVNWCHLAPESAEELEERLSGEPGTTGTSKPWAKVTGIVPSRKRKPSKHIPVNILCQNCGMHTTDVKICDGCGKNPQQVPVKAPVHNTWGGSSY